MGHWRAWMVAAVLGVSVPTIAVVGVAPVAIAQTSPNGVFQDGTWRVEVRYSGGTHTYYGENRNSGDGIYLSGAAVSGNSARRVYTWNNGGTRYQVSWQPGDPDTIRLQVFASNGRSLMNRLLSRISY